MWFDMSAMTTLVNNVLARSVDEYPPDFSHNSRRICSRTNSAEEQVERKSKDCSAGSRRQGRTRPDAFRERITELPINNISIYLSINIKFISHILPVRM